MINTQGKRIRYKPDGRCRRKNCIDENVDKEQKKNEKKASTTLNFVLRIFFFFFHNARIKNDQVNKHTSIQVKSTVSTYPIFFFDFVY